MRSLIFVLLLSGCTQQNICEIEQGSTASNNWCGKGSPTPVPGKTP